MASHSLRSDEGPERRHCELLGLILLALAATTFLWLGNVLR